MDLPITKYHPDPVATGSVEANPDQPCLCCNRIRGYVYTGPAYSERFHYLSGCLCPWCVADGSAAKAFGAEFADTGTLDDVPKAVLEELAKRTPGFMAWQQERWLCCCDDAAAYLGRAGAAELAGELAGARPAVERWLRQECGLASGEVGRTIAGMGKDREPTAYVFRCLHCAAYLAYSDEA